MFLQCGVCDEVFNCTPELDAHKSLHDPSDRISCRRCGHLSTTLKRHRKHAQHCFLCQQCGIQCGSEATYAKHQCLAEFERAITCACGSTFEKYCQIIAHANGPKPLYCCRCDYKSRKLISLVLHFATHKDELSSFNCAFCLATFDTLQELKYHTTTLHLLIESVTKCEDCGKQVPLRMIETHRAAHHVSSCLCPGCGKIFDSPSRLAQHLANQCHSQPLTCDLCKKVLKTKKILGEHMKTHLTTASGTRMPQAICPLCGIELAQKGSLQRHIQVVHEKDTLEPKEEVPRQCQQCGLVLPSIGKYYSHQRQHRAELERHVCEICARVFNKKANLLRHRQLVHGAESGGRLLLENRPTYTCKICLEVFGTRPAYGRHYQRSHQNLC